MDKFEGKEMELRAWKNLQNLRQEEEEEVEDLVAKTEKLFKKAKMVDETIRFRCLLSSIAPKYQRTILNRKVKTYKDAILIANDEEKLEKICNYDSEKPNSSKKDDSIFKKLNEENGVYEMLVKKIDNLNLNLINLVNGLHQEKKTSSIELKPDRVNEMKRGQFLYCKNIGNFSKDCPKGYWNKQKNTTEVNKDKKKVSCIEVDVMLKEENSFYSLDSELNLAEKRKKIMK
ncbi:hypothetical protein AYI69_g535 [Smittium culicis]|uniref:Uncharacterized protein n=1 Tax=Smittium culicis TaxID=133412 RepID=A0A1R1YSS4_9FUNG|nr:hypothetical protein AYI69_g535 [Smittium culicis]